MHFEEPIWLLLLPALALLGWQRPRLELHRPLRVAIAVLLALALADPQWQRLEPGTDLWVLVDRSTSAADLLGPRLNEWEGLLRHSMGSNDRLRFVDFGEDAVVRPEDAGVVSEVQPYQTRVANALGLAVAQHDPNHATRFLLLTDGYPTEPLGASTELLQRSGISLDLRFVALEKGVDYQLDSIAAPARVMASEPFVVDVRIHADGAATGSVPYQIQRDGATVLDGRVDLINGVGRVRVTDRLTHPGAAHYTAQIFPEGDPRPGNNASDTWVESITGPHVLLITAFADDPVAATLTAQGIAVDVETNPANLNAGRLTEARAVILNDVPANQIPADFMKQMEFFVRDQGGGLMMLGGKNSYGTGGYYGSRLDGLLPVSMEQKEEKRKLEVAMAIVLDRSGSMAAVVSSATGGKVKMDLADAGSMEAIKLLGPKDAVAVFAVDTEAHPIVPLSTVEPGRAALMESVSRIHAGGGGIFVYNGLVAAHQELQRIQTGQKHIILFADANDAKQPDDYIRLLDTMTAEGITVSVIGLGSPTDQDANFLKDIADRGHGRIFFNANANDLPGIFAQDTVAVARSRFIDEATPIQGTATWLELAARPIDWFPQVDGYNVCYLQPQATTAALTSDDNASPLVAFWNRGAGRAIAVTFPLAGNFSDSSRAWPAYGDFITTMTRWVMGTATPPGLGVKAHLEGDQLVVDLYYDTDQEKELALHFPQSVVSQGGMDERKQLTWERLEPGHFQARTRLAPGKPAVGAVQVGQHALPFGPLAPGLDLEWHRDSAGPRSLRSLSAATGGRELAELRDAWRDTGQHRFLSLRSALLILLVLAVVAEALTTRLGVLTRWRRKNELPPKVPAAS